jgi:2-hydroxychromene-2-carboxylate isomerase
LLWSPVLLGAIYRQTAAPQGAAGSASDVFNSAKKAVSSQAINRTLSRYKIPFHQPEKHPNKTTAALRLIYSLPNEERPALSKALFKAYWVDNQDVSDPAVLKDIASQCGISNIQTDTPALRASLEDATLKAVARGAPGVPGFWVPAERWSDSAGKTHQGRLYWGQDRMHFVEAVLISLNRGITYQQVPGLAGLQPRCLHSSVAPRPTKLEFYYDFSSPWAFLGWTQLARMKREAGANLQIELKPFLLGALFREYASPPRYSNPIPTKSQTHSQPNTESAPR